MTLGLIKGGQNRKGVDSGAGGEDSLGQVCRVGGEEGRKEGRE